MKLFSIDADNTITTFAAAEQLPEGQERFTSEEELFDASTTWPADRLVAVWNSFAGAAGFGAGLKPVKKFTDRTVACKRIWNAIQKLDGEAAAETTEGAAAAKAPKAKAAKSAPKAKKAAKSKEAAGPREGTKAAQVVAMLQRKNGATLNELASTFQYARHTIRGMVAGSLKKAGYKIESFKNPQGDRTYRITE